MIRSKSRGIVTNRNHIIVMADMESEEEAKHLKTAVKKIAREMRLSGKAVSFEMYINSQCNSHLED